MVSVEVGNALTGRESDFKGVAGGICLGIDISRGGFWDSRILASTARCFAFARPVRVSSGVVLIALGGLFADVRGLVAPFSCVKGMVIRNWGGFLVY